MNFKDILNNEREKLEVFIGYNEDTIKKINLMEMSSILITGSTGTSKSVMINEILLQLIEKNTPSELEIVTINPTKVELSPYRFTKYAKHKNIRITSHNFKKIIELVDERLNNDLIDSLPYTVIAIDEMTDILKEKDSEEDLKWLIENCSKAKVILLLITNDIYSEFFKKDYNLLVDVRLSFDYTSKEDSKMIDLKGSQYLKLMQFLISYKNKTKSEIYNIFIFDDELVPEILEEIK